MWGVVQSHSWVRLGHPYVYQSHCIPVPLCNPNPKPGTGKPWYWYKVWVGHIVLVHNGIGTYGTGTQWDWDIWYWYTMGLGHMVLVHSVSGTHGTGTQCDWDTMGMVLSGGTDTMVLVHTGTGTQWLGDMVLVHSGTGTWRYWYTVYLEHNGHGI